MTTMVTAITSATADGAAASDGLPSVPPGAGAGRKAEAAGACEGKRWLAAQGRPGRRFFLAAALADLAATVGTVILSWYIAALIVAGVVGTAAGHGLAGDVLGVVTGGFLRAAYDVGFDGYLVKPVDFDRMAELIKSLLPAR